MTNLRHIFSIFGLALIVAGLSNAAAAQSNDQNFPTSITSNQLDGSIKARDVGDSRNTTYYFAFAGTNGDIFINLVTKNFVGDIDVFTQDGLRSLTKIVVFDAGLHETGRLIYLRKDERMLLRIQGRTPGDDAASFQIKFGGSFVALRPGKEEAPPTIADGEEQSTVNSVGTRLPAKPKPVAPPATAKSNENIANVPEPPKSNPASQPEVSTKSETAKEPKPEVVIESTIKPVTKITPPAKPDPKKSTAAKKTTTVNPPPKEKEPDPLASIRLMVLMKDGSVIERQMNEVLRFSVDKGVLTVILKDGGISRYPITQVARVTIE